MTSLVRVLTPGFLILVLLSCSPKGATDSGLLQSATFGEIEREVFAVTCAITGCHTGTDPSGELNLSGPQSYYQLVRVSSVQVPGFFRVKPYDSNDSYLIMKLVGDSRMNGNPMPLTGSQLEPQIVDSIRAWIDNGALNN